MVWTMLFSNVFLFPKHFKIDIEITAAGMEAEIVLPIFIPTYVVEIASKAAKKDPKIKLFIVTSSFFNFLGLSLIERDSIFFVVKNQLSCKIASVYDILPGEVLLMVFSYLSKELSFSKNLILANILIFACAQIYIPLDPVPITLQTLGVMLVALIYDAKTAFSSVASYIFLGALGVPIWQDYTSGFGVLFGVTGGYLMGFLPGAYLTAKLKEKMGILGACIIGSMAIFALGIFWLSFFIGIKMAFVKGFFPFIIPGAIKALLAFGIVKFLKIA